MNATSRTECKRNEATRVTSVRTLVKSAIVFSTSGTCIQENYALCITNITILYFIFIKIFLFYIIIFFLEKYYIFKTKIINIYIVQTVSYY